MFESTEHTKVIKMTLRPSKKSNKTRESAEERKFRIRMERETLDRAIKEGKLSKHPKKIKLVKDITSSVKSWNVANSKDFGKISNVKVVKYKEAKTWGTSFTVKAKHDIGAEVMGSDEILQSMVYDAIKKVYGTDDFEVDGKITETDFEMWVTILN